MITITLPFYSRFSPHVEFHMANSMQCAEKQRNLYRLRILLLTAMRGFK